MMMWNRVLIFLSLTIMMIRAQNEPNEKAQIQVEGKDNKDYVDSERVSGDPVGKDKKTNNK